MKTLSAFVGILAEIRLPRFMRSFIFNFYCSLYKVNKQELNRDLVDYNSFQDFFSREINPSLRPLANSKFISPVDGLLVDYGHFSSKTAVNVKSFSYLLEQLIPDPKVSKFFIDGLYVILYLSPRDYHRIHSPCDSVLKGYLYVPGDLKTVNPSQGNKLPIILATNKRLISLLEDSSGRRLAVVKVGATNVGSINYSVIKNANYSTVLTNVEIPLSKGQELAKFNLGSTVVLCFEKNSISKISLKQGDYFKMGQELSVS